MEGGEWWGYVFQTYILMVSARKKSLIALLFCFLALKRPLAGKFFLLLKSPFNFWLTYERTKWLHQYFKRYWFFFINKFAKNVQDFWWLFCLTFDFDLTLWPRKCDLSKKNFCSHLIYVFPIQWYQFRHQFPKFIFWPPKVEGLLPYIT